MYKADITSVISMTIWYEFKTWPTPLGILFQGTLDIYLNSTSLRLNEIMKALTIVSTVFLPLSFIAGVFGMNFSKIPGSTHPLGFYFTSIGMVLLGFGMFAYFKKRGWF